MTANSINRFFNKSRGSVLVLALVAGLLYLKTLPYEFIGLDEHTLLVDKKEFNSRITNSFNAFGQHVFETENHVSATDSKQFYRPMLTLSFIIDQQWAGEGFKGFHFTNILIHWAASCGLFFLLQAMGTVRPVSFLLTLLFLVHPAMNQAVAWIPGRNDSMVGGFLFWSFWFLLQFLKEQKPSQLLGYVLLFLFALFTKENAVMMIFLSAAWIFFIHKTPKAVALKIAGATLLPVLVWFLARHAALNDPMTGFMTPGLLYESLIKNLPLVLQSFQKIFVPANLAVMASVKDIHPGWVVLAFALVGYAIYKTPVIPWSRLLFGFGWFLLFLLPTLLFSYFEGMEHRIYLPAAGLLMALAETSPIKNLIKKNNNGFYAGIAVIMTFAFITHFRLPVFSSELNYWKNAYETSEHSAVVCRDYGVILTQTGNFAEAEKAYLEGIRRDPKAPLVHYNLGVMYRSAGRKDLALEYISKEKDLNPGNFMVWHVLGVLEKESGRPAVAVQHWEKAVSIYPDFTESYKELLNQYGRSGDSLNFNRIQKILADKGYSIVKQKQPKQ